MFASPVPDVNSFGETSVLVVQAVVPLTLYCTLLLVSDDIVRQVIV